MSCLGAAHFHLTALERDIFFERLSNGQLNTAEYQGGYLDFICK